MNQMFPWELVSEVQELDVENLKGGVFFQDEEGKRHVVDFLAVDGDDLILSENKDGNEPEELDSLSGTVC